MEALPCLATHVLFLLLLWAKQTELSLPLHALMVVHIFIQCFHGNDVLLYCWECNLSQKCCFLVEAGNHMFI